MIKMGNSSWESEQKNNVVNDWRKVLNNEFNINSFDVTYDKIRAMRYVMEEFLETEIRIGKNNHPDRGAPPPKEPRR